MFHTSTSDGCNKKALCLIAPGFEEIEFVTPVDILRRAGVHVTIASIADTIEPVAGMMKVQVVPDAVLADVKNTTFDLVFLPGGGRAANAFAESADVGEVLKHHNEEGKMIAAISSSTTVFDGFEINRGKKCISYPSYRDQLRNHYECSEDAVVVDGNMVTSRGPGTAFAYGLALLERLCGTAKGDQVASRMLYEQ